MSIHPDLITRAQAGDRIATEALVKHHRRLISYLCFRLAGRQMPDLIQEGIVALLANLPGYDPAKGASFATYIYPRIRGAMLAFLGHEWAYRRRWQEDVTEAIAGRTFSAPAPDDAQPLLSCLTEQEREVIERLYGFRGPVESTADVARFLGLGMRRVQQIHCAALDRLKTLFAEDE